MKTEIFNYNGNNITFQLGNGDVMVNATQMAKHFGKRPNDYLNIPTTKNLIEAITRKNGIDENQIVSTTRGGTNSGTWLHEDIAIDFAQWLSIDFKLWCNDKIKELLTKGVSTVNNEDDTIAQALSILQKRLDDNKQRVQILEGENSIQKEEIKTLAPKAEYTDKVLQSTSTLTINEIAMELGLTSQGLNKELKELGVQYKQGKQWLISAKFRDKGYTELRTYSKANPETGETKTHSYTVWTEKGRQFIHSNINKPNRNLN